MAGMADIIQDVIRPTKPNSIRVMAGMADIIRSNVANDRLRLRVLQ